MNTVGADWLQRDAGEIGDNVGREIGRGIGDLVEELLADGLEVDRAPEPSGLVMVKEPSDSRAAIG